MNGIGNLIACKILSAILLLLSISFGAGFIIGIEVVKTPRNKQVVDGYKRGYFDGARNLITRLENRDSTDVFSKAWEADSAKFSKQWTGNILLDE